MLQCTWCQWLRHNLTQIGNPSGRGVPRLSHSFRLLPCCWCKHKHGAWLRFLLVIVEQIWWCERWWRCLLSMTDEWMVAAVVRSTQQPCPPSPCHVQVVFTTEECEISRESERQSVVSRLGASTRGHNKYSSFWSDCVFAVVTVKIITVPTPAEEILRTRDRGGGRGYLLRVVLPWHGEAGAASSSFTPPAPSIPSSIRLLTIVASFQMTVVLLQHFEE